VKLVLVLVAAVAAASIAATLAIGGRLREDTVVPDPYEAGVRWDRDHPRAGADAARPGAAASAVARPAAARCNLADGPCHRAADDLAIALDVSPRPLRTLSRLAVAADVSAGGAPVAGATVEVAFAMQGMTMGENRSPLHAGDAPGRYAGEGVLVRCASGRRDWTATVTVRRPGRPEARAAFDLRVAE
jgi:hypothetical protein